MTASAERSSITTILFTDLVNSTDLTRRIGDEQAQRIFEAHHKALGEALASHGGEELQWLGDGVMAAFASTADAVRCAIALQRATRQPISGQQLAIRAGLNVGEILRQKTGSGYFGTPVVVARRLCDRAEAGQILASSVVAGLLAGRQAFSFRDRGLAELKGLPDRVGVCEVVYDTDEPTSFFVRTPFVGREAEVQRLVHRVSQAREGHGSIFMLVGEPGIGKTRALEEVAAIARREGTRVLWGRCHEGEVGAPYGPFGEALTQYAKESGAEALREDLARYGGVLATLVPAVRDTLPDLPEPPRLEPEEERSRLFDAVAQFLVASSKRAPLVLVLDDLHWADRATIALLQYLARFLEDAHVVLAGAYRDVELDRQHPLASALPALKREAAFERISLKGLGPAEVGELLKAITAQDVPPVLVEAISRETEGNPFFIREILLHLVEDGKVFREQDRWTSRLSIEDLGIPEGVREVVGRRLSRLSPAANRLLHVASAFQGAFSFAVAAAAAELEEHGALDALDEALDVQLLRSTPAPDEYDFTHALIRHTLYAELNPSRQVRLHRRIAEEIERIHAGLLVESAAEIARHYHRSSALPGAERGVEHCSVAADQAEKTAAYEEAATLLRMALDLVPREDVLRPRLLARLSLDLARSGGSEEAREVAVQAGELLAATEGSDAAADHFAVVANAAWGATNGPLAWELAEHGLRHIGSRRDIIWAHLMLHALWGREAASGMTMGFSIDSPERRELSRFMLTNPRSFEPGLATMWRIFSSRTEVLQNAADDPFALCYWAGEYRRALGLFQELIEPTLERGQIGVAAMASISLARALCALGDFEASNHTYSRATDLAGRIKRSPFLEAQLLAVPGFQAWARGDRVQPFLPLLEALVAQATVENQWLMSALLSIAAKSFALADRSDEAIRYVEAALPAIDHAPGWAVNYTLLIDSACAALWYSGRADHAATLERNLREKTLAPDFRYDQTDSRLALARLCALQARYDEASEWFARARVVLDEQGARPLRALVDFDDAWMHLRRGADGDRERALRLLDAATRRFGEIGMPGWIDRAEGLRRQVA